MQNQIMKFKFSTFQLKFIAIVCMTIDHIGAVLYPQFPLFRFFGRISFPLFAYACSNSIFFLKDKPQRFLKYIITLFIFGVISQPIYEISFFGETLNIMFSMAYACIAIWFYEFLHQKCAKYFSFIVIFELSVLASVFHLSYGFLGILLIFGFYMDNQSRNKKKKHLFGITSVLIMTGINIILGINGNWWIHLGTLFVIPIIFLSNGERGCNNKFFKWFFYLYYPLHLTVICLIKLI